MTTSHYTVERGLRLVAGVLILISVALGIYQSAWWFAFTAFVGANLLQSGFTNWCPMMPFLRQLGFQPEGRADEPQHLEHPRAA